MLMLECANWLASEQLYVNEWDAMLELMEL